MELSLCFNHTSPFVEQFFRAEIQETTSKETSSLFTCTREQLLLRIQDPLPVKITISVQLPKGAPKRTITFDKVEGTKQYRHRGVSVFEIR